MQSKKVVDVKSESAEHIHAVIRTEHNPLFSKMWVMCEGRIASMSDLMFDAVRLSHAKPHNKFLWGIGSHTSLFRLTENSDLLAALKATNISFDNWHVIEISRIQSGMIACGYITPTNSDSWDHIKEVIEYQLYG